MVKVSVTKHDKTVSKKQGTGVVALVSHFEEGKETPVDVMIELKDPKEMEVIIYSFLQFINQNNSQFLKAILANFIANQIKSEENGPKIHIPNQPTIFTGKN